MSDVTIYGFPQSSYVRTVRLVCAEKGVEDEVVGLDFGSDELLAVQPFGKIPGFRHGDFELYETSAIIAYIDEAFDGPALQPEDPRSRAVMNQWLSAFCDYGYQCMIRELVIPRLVHPNRGIEVDEAAVAAAVPKIADFFRIAGEALSQRDYFAGDAPTLADFMALPQISYVSVTPEGEALFAGAAPVAAWLERMTARPSFAATQPPPPKATEAAE